MTHKRAYKPTSRLCLEWCANPYQLRQGSVIFYRSWLAREREDGFILLLLYWSSPSSMPVFHPSFSPLPNDTTLTKWEGKSSLKLFLFLFWFQRNTPELCIRISIIPSITKANHFLLLIIRRGAETKQEADPDSPICFAGMEFDFKSLPKITLKG